MYGGMNLYLLFCCIRHVIRDYPLYQTVMALYQVR